jgi:lysophospholipase L1-like esterase
MKQWIFRKLRKILSHFTFFPQKHRQRFVYVAIGDSSVEGVGASHHTKSYPSLVFEKIKQSHPQGEYHNLGKSGDRIKHVVKNQLPQVLELKPNLITISIGVNDIRGHIKLSQYEKDLTYLIEILQRKTDAKIIINNIPDFSSLPTLPIYIRIASKILIHRFNKSIEKISDNFGLTLVDIFKVSRQFYKQWRNLISSDGYHPSDAGYALWAQAVIENLKQNISNT